MIPIHAKAEVVDGAVDLVDGDETGLRIEPLELADVDALLGKVEVGRIRQRAPVFRPGSTLLPVELVG